MSPRSGNGSAVMRVFCAQAPQRACAQRAQASLPGFFSRLKANPATSSAPPTSSAHSNQDFQSRCFGAGVSAREPAWLAALDDPIDSSEAEAYMAFRRMARVFRAWRTTPFLLHHSKCVHGLVPDIGRLGSMHGISLCSS